MNAKVGDLFLSETCSEGIMTDVNVEYVQKAAQNLKAASGGRGAGGGVVVRISYHPSSLAECVAELENEVGLWG